MCLYTLTESSTLTSCVISLSSKQASSPQQEKTLLLWNQSLFSHSPQHKMGVPADKTTANLSTYGLQVYFKIQFPVSVIKYVLYYTPTNLQ